MVSWCLTEEHRDRDPSEPSEQNAEVPVPALLGSLSEVSFSANHTEAFFAKIGLSWLSSGSCSRLLAREAVPGNPSPT